MCTGRLGTSAFGSPGYHWLTVRLTGKLVTPPQLVVKKTTCFPPKNNRARAHTCAAVESQATGGVHILNEELGQDNFIYPQGVVPVLPVKHQVVLVVRVYTKET